MSNCLFCSIVEGRIPSYPIYEDDYYLAIMDRYPCAKGHVLIMPKRHVPDVFELSEAEALALLPLAQKIAAKMRDELKMDGLNMLQNNGKAAGQEIEHFHLHLLPRYNGDGLKLNNAKPTDPPLDELAKYSELLRTV